jgi:eukaryotic-like serine/threonine-protein kinase
VSPKEREDPLTLVSAEGEASAGRRAVSELLGDRYEVVAKLGAGAFGEVYEATDTTLHRKVAIKRIRLDAFAEGPELEEVKARFLREAQVAAKLRHPNIVTIHDIAAKDASSFMVMERVEGRTLQDVLQERGRLGVQETIHLVSQAAAALDYAHGNGVVHRDVKPSNLMVEPSGHVKVMDFGIAKAASSRNITQAGTIVGTPNYMAPEQARGGQVDGRADLFSLGCILYECLAGRRPFEGESVTAILLKIVSEPPPEIDFAALHLPESLGPVLRKALAKNPQDRYPSGEALMAALRDAALTVKAVVPPPVPTLVASEKTRSSGGPPTAPAGRRRLPWLLAAGVAAVVLFAAVLWSVSAFQGTPGAPSADGAPASGSKLMAPKPVRLSPHVVKDEPPLAKRLLGAKPILHVSAPAGSTLVVRLDKPLSSETARPEQTVTATTDAPLVVDGHDVVPAGARVSGRVVHAAPSGKVSGRGELTIEFDRVLLPGHADATIGTESLHWTARSTVKQDTAKVGGGAVLGAVVGGILGGKKGAAIGGAVGGSAGAGVVLATKGEEVVLREGTRLDVRLRSPLTVTIAEPEK